ncbi:hypothetical protein HZB01_02955, partial [Candidatus Woesearchaeota archaeon]|nr:hypothetical protein [Candidatus Woesearchaeota archaeon]
MTTLNKRLALSLLVIAIVFLVGSVYISGQNVITADIHLGFLFMAVFWIIVVWLIALLLF